MTSGESENRQLHALIVATEQYKDPTLEELRSPSRDAEEVTQVLRDPAIGGYGVQTLLDRQDYLLREEIEGFLADRSLDELLVLYISCHGVKDASGRLYFAAVNTKLNRLAATGISADFVYELIDRCRARRVLLLLDCCYSGAYRAGHRPRGKQRAAIKPLDGYGRAIITSSTALEYSFEVDTGGVTGIGAQSVFTTALVEGLRTGDADRNGDGFVSVDELYSYVYERVRQATPDQTPEIKWGNVRGDFIIATNPHPPSARSEFLPADLIAALGSPDANVRANAVRELARLARVDDSPLVSAAAEATLVGLQTYPAIQRKVKDDLPRAGIPGTPASSVESKAVAADMLTAPAHQRQAGDEPSRPTGVRGTIASAQRETVMRSRSLLTLSVKWVIYPLLMGLILGGSTIHQSAAAAATFADPLSGGVSAVAFSPDGATLAVGDRNRHTYLWNVASGKVTANFKNPDGAGNFATVYAMAFSPDGATLASGDGNGHTYLWNVASGKVTANLKNPDGASVDAVAFSPDGATLAAGSDNGHTYLWNVASGKVTANFKNPDRRDPVYAVDFSPDGATLATGYENGTTNLWNVATRKITATLKNIDGASINAVAFSPDGAALAIADDNGTTFLRKVGSGRITATLNDPDSAHIEAVAFNPRGSTLATGNINSTTYLWNLVTRRIMAAVQDPGSAGVSAVAFSPSGAILATGDYNGSTYIWNLIRRRHSLS